jgi:hypothetical protein
MARTAHKGRFRVDRVYWSRIASRSSGPILLAAVGLALTLLSSAAGAVGPPVFKRVGSYATGRGSADLVVRDFNRDGRLDIATANLDSNTISILLRKRTGGFLPRRDYPTPRSPWRLVSGDFDGDRRPDLAIGSGATVSVFRNKGRGAFARRTEYPVAGGLNGVAIGDVTGDRRPDLVVVSPGDLATGGGLLTVMRNQDGRFPSAATYPVGESPRSVAVADVNNDGRRDAVTASFKEDSFSVLLNGGDGAFGNEVRYETGSRPFAVAIGDLNRDGHPDLVLAHEIRADNDGCGNVSTWFNRGNGTFRRSGGFACATRQPGGVTVGNLNADRLPDLAIPHVEGIGFSVLLNRGRGRFDETELDIGRAYAREIAIADFNGDGRRDLFVSLGTKVSVWLNKTRLTSSG